MRKRGDLWETIGEERKRKMAAVEHSRGEGTETRVEQAWIKQPVVKGSLSPARIKKIFSVSVVPALAFSTAALLASVPGCCLLAGFFAKVGDHLHGTHVAFDSGFSKPLAWHGNGLRQPGLPPPPPPFLQAEPLRSALPA